MEWGQAGCWGSEGKLEGCLGSAKKAEEERGTGGTGLEPRRWKDRPLRSEREKRESSGQTPCAQGEEREQRRRAKAEPPAARLQIRRGEPGAGGAGRVLSEGRSGTWRGPARRRRRWARRAGCAPATTASTTASWSPSRAPGAGRRPRSATAAASQTSSTAAASRAATSPTSTATCGASGGQGRRLAGRGGGEATAKGSATSGGGKAPASPRPAQGGPSGRTRSLLDRKGSAEKTPAGSEMPREPGLLGRGSDSGRQRCESALGPQARRAREERGLCARGAPSQPGGPGSVPRQPRGSGLLFTLPRVQTQAGDSSAWQTRHAHNLRRF